MPKSIVDYGPILGGAEHAQQSYGSKKFWEERERLHDDGHVVHDFNTDGLCCRVDDGDYCIDVNAERGA